MISGNNSYGGWIEDSGTNNNSVLGNYIGTDATDNTALGNTQSGFLIQNSADGTITGGTASAAGAASAAGTASAALGATQFLLAALVSPLVSIGGEPTGEPLAAVMVVASVLACAGFALARPASE